MDEKTTEDRGALTQLIARLHDQYLLFALGLSIVFFGIAAYGPETLRAAVVPLVVLVAFVLAAEVAKLIAGRRRPSGSGSIDARGAEIGGSVSTGDVDARAGDSARSGDISARGASIGGPVRTGSVGSRLRR